MYACSAQAASRLLSGCQDGQAKIKMIKGSTGQQGSQVMDTVEPNVGNGKSQPEQLLLREEVLFELSLVGKVRLGCGAIKKKGTKCAFFFFFFLRYLLF